MRTSFTIILFILALVLGGLAVVHTGDKYREKIFGTAAVKPGEKLFDTQALDNTWYVTMANTDGTTVRLKRTGHFWSATEPWKDRADPLFVAALFKFTASLVVQEVIDLDDLALQDFGLADDHVRITMLDKNEKEVCDYRIGRTSAWKIPSEDGKSTQPTIFIRLADKDKKNKIYICSSESAGGIHSLFNNDFARFRDHHPLHFSPRFLDKVRLQSEEVEVVLSRPNLKTGWMITKPNKLRVDPEAQLQLFNDLARLTALKVENRSSVTLPTAEEDVTQAREISIHFAGEQKDITLRVYPPLSEDTGIALATVSDRPDTVFHLPLTKAAAIPGTTALNLLQAGVNDLRSKTMTHLNGPQLQTIIIRPSGLQDILLKRTRQTEWQCLRPNGWQPVNTDTLVRLIIAFTRDKVVKFVTDAASDLSPYGLDRPLVRIGFNSFNGEKMRLAIGRGPKDNKLYAYILGRPNVWEISSETFGKIALYPWQWRTPHVWHIPKVDIQKITIQRKGQPKVELNYAFFTEKWQAMRDGKDVTAELNPSRANFFLKQLTSLKASRWIGPMHASAMEAMKSPDTIIQIHVKQVNDEGFETEPAIKTLRIAHTKGGYIYFAKVDTQPAGNNRDHESSYFYLSPDVISKLYVDLFE